jgi:hypothetical protein
LPKLAFVNADETGLVSRSEKSVMKTRFIMFNRSGVFYSEDTTTGKQHSLRTKDEAEALAILHSKNEAHRQPVLNLQIARTYLTATDPEVARRTTHGPNAPKSQG